MQSCPNSVHHGEISISTGNCQVDKILAEFSDVFDSPSKPLSPCNLIECDIPTGDARPIRQRAYRTPLTKRKLIEDQINEMLEQGIIRPSSSPYASPVTLVPLKSGEYRFCVDYRKLNSVTIISLFAKWTISIANPEMLSTLRFFCGNVILSLQNCRMPKCTLWAFFSN